MRRLLNQLVPFIFMGIAVVAFVFAIMLFSYLFLFGALIGFVLFVITWVRQRFFSSITKGSAEKKAGRIIDVNHWNK